MTEKKERKQWVFVCECWSIFWCNSIHQMKCSIVTISSTTILHLIWTRHTMFWYFKWQFSYLTQNISKHWFELQTSHMRCQFWHISKKSIEDVAKFSKNFISLHALKITDSETTQICELTLYFHYDAFKILNQLK